ncbi:hypothetical protein [Curtobacterium sp. USHLN213]|uniref:hypothetical protein n=1 Tax=Curtobacterium sp. USHLN213 TaxID=3081255 RepID=UPI0030187F42
MIRIHKSVASGARIIVNLPDASRIAVPAVAKAAQALEASYARLTEAERTYRAADLGVVRATEAMEEAARAAAIEGGFIPRDIREGVAAARDDLEQATVELKAFEDAFVHAHNTLVITMEANRDKLRKAALADAERSLTALASARKAVEVAIADSVVTFGLAGMVSDEGNGPTTRERKGSRRLAVLQAALEPLSEGVGLSSNDLDWYRRG